MRALTFITGLLLAPAVMAQTPAPGQADMMHVMQLAARNQLGVFEYCQSQGSVGPDIVALQRRLIGMLPQTDAVGLDDAEAAGKEGRVEFGGAKVTLADAAKAQNLSAGDMCKKMADLVMQQAASLPK